MVQKQFRCTYPFALFELHFITSSNLVEFSSELADPLWLEPYQIGTDLKLISLANALCHLKMQLQHLKVTFRRSFRSQCSNSKFGPSWFESKVSNWFNKNLFIETPAMISKARLPKIVALEWFGHPKFYPPKCYPESDFIEIIFRLKLSSGDLHQTRVFDGAALRRR